MFYTRKGDDGTTGSLGKGRLPKSDARIEALGTLDEAAAVLGIARSLCRELGTAEAILQTQRDLYSLMAEVSASPENAEKYRKIGPQQVAWLEEQIETFQGKTLLPEEFIITGDTSTGAFLDLARTVVRRAERKVAVLVSKKWIVNPDILRYINRLSSLCFILELYENQSAGINQPTLARI